MRETPRWQFAVGLLFTIGGLALVSISFATDNWIETTIDRTSLDEDLVTEGTTLAAFADNPLFYTRNRGLFRTCYSGNETTFLDSRDDVLDGKCLREQGYELPKRREETTNYPSAYETRFHLMRSHVAAFILSILFFSISVIMGLFGIYKLKINLTQITGLIIFAGAFFAATGMAMFHGYDYIEKNEFDSNFMGSEDLYSYWADFYPILDDNAEVAYGYSYILGWISVGLGAIGGMLFLCASSSLRDAIRVERRKDRKRAKKEKKAKEAESFDNFAYNPYGSPMDQPQYPTYDPYAAYTGGAGYPALPY